MADLLDAGDLAEALEALGGVSVTVGAATVKGLVYRGAVLLDDGAPGGAPVVGELLRVTIETGSLPAIDEGGQVTVGGTVYRVIRIMAAGVKTYVSCGVAV